MVNERKGSFRAWLLEQMRREDAVGDFARDVAADPCLGKKRTPNAIARHIEDEHYPYDDNVMVAWARALREWRSARAVTNIYRGTI
jgi:hypothetical protein